MNPVNTNVLTINVGSSRIKFGLYKLGEPMVKLFCGALENIGSKSIQLIFTNKVSQQKESYKILLPENKNVADILIEWLEKQEGFNKVKAIGHRIVHGMGHTMPKIINDELLEELKTISAYDPEHLTEEIKLIEFFRKKFPDLIQVACFDTSFYTDMPAIAKMLPIPLKYQAEGIHLYGFHGISYSYLLETLERLAGREVANGKLIMAHLGSCASITAVKNGKSVDTSMGFTPNSGLTMDSSEKLSPAKFKHLVNHESGLLGISETSADMQELIKIKELDSRAAEAFELFCYQAKKYIGSFTAVLGGLDTLVFSGGIGENSSEVRSKICNHLHFFGIELDETKNMNNEGIISTDFSSVVVRVIKTNEELMMAQLINGIIINKKAITNLN